MKFRTYGMVLSLLFALGLVFSFGTIDAYGAHGDGSGKRADAVTPTSEDDVEAFLDHIVEYYNQEYDKARMSSQDPAEVQIEVTRALIVYARDIRRNNGVYNHSGDDTNNMYSFGINEGGIVTNHSAYPYLLGRVFDSSATGEVASTIQTLIDRSDIDSKECVTYGSENRVACAEKVDSPSGVVTTIAGLHHLPGDNAFDEPDCTGFELNPTAQQVYEDQKNDDKLKAYVKEIIRVVQEQFRDINFEAGMENRALAAAAAGGDQAARDALQKIAGGKIFGKTACFGSMHFKHKNIYAFVMDARPAVSTVLFNGNNFDLNGANLELNDNQLPGDDKSISGLFNRELGTPEAGASTFVTYRWDDPETEADDVPNFFEEGVVPGTSCKRSYIEVADLTELLKSFLPPGTPPTLYIFGSGTYPGDEACAGDGETPTEPEMPTEEDDGDGCAIAGAGHTSQSTLLNLFLIASVLFSVAFLRRRV